MNEELHFGNDELRQHTESVISRNDLLSAVLTGLRAGVAVVDEQYRVLSWNAAAEDLWGVQEDEVLGQPLAELDIGLPVDRLTPLLRPHIDADGSHGDLVLPAVNRRGRSIEVRVTVSPLRSDLVRGSIVLMDPRQH